MAIILLMSHEPLTGWAECRIDRTVGPSHSRCSYLALASVPGFP